VKLITGENMMANLILWEGMIIAISLVISTQWHQLLKRWLIVVLIVVTAICLMPCLSGCNRLLFSLLQLFDNQLFFFLFPPLLSSLITYSGFGDEAAPQSVRNQTSHHLVYFFRF
jgi:hypothetical protein